MKQGIQKIVIYEESIDNIVGYVHARDIFDPPDSIKNILRPIEMFPETMAANEFLSELIKSKKSIAVVLDEFGGTSGIITIEDIIEEIFGEIEDEFDIDDNREKKISDNEYIFSSRLEVDYLNEKYNFDFPVSEEYETLGGLIISQHESIPVVNEEIEFENYKFTVLKASKNRIEEVKFELL